MVLNPSFQVPLPSKGIIVTKSKYPYVFRVLKTFRNEKGQPTNQKVSIGKLDTETGMLIPNITYYRYYGEETSPKTVVPQHEFGAKYEVGVPFFTDWIFSSLGIDKMLDESLGPFKAARARTVAAYMLAEGNVMSGIDQFCEDTLLSGRMSDQDASRLFSSIRNEQRMKFFESWVKQRPQNEYLAYDVTSFSSYSEGITDTEWCYNRDGDKLPQFNLGMYIGYESHLPVFYVTYPGSIIDKSYLPCMMAYNKDLGIKDVSFVMDRGFQSTSNMEYMCSMGYPFIVSVENRNKSVKKDIIKYGNAVKSAYYRLGDMKIFGMRLKGRYLGIRSNLHIFYDYDKMYKQTNDLFTKIESEEFELVQKNCLTDAEIRKYKNHFIINETNNGEKFSWCRNYVAIDNFTSTMGYMCILTNSNFSSQEVLMLYRKRNIIENCFKEIKNNIEIGHLMTHNDETNNGKIFCAFLALIVRLYILDQLFDWMHNHRCTTNEVVKELAKIRAIIGKDGVRVESPLTKKQREILAVFHATEADVLKYLKASVA
jgi:transposase